MIGFNFSLQELLRKLEQVNVDTIPNVFLLGLLHLLSQRLLNALRSTAPIQTESIHPPPSLVSVIVDLIWASMRTELSLAHSLKWNNWFWPALLVITECLHARRALVQGESQSLDLDLICQSKPLRSPSSQFNIHIII